MPCRPSRSVRPPLRPQGVFDLTQARLATNFRRRSIPPRDLHAYELRTPTERSPMSASTHGTPASGYGTDLIRLRGVAGVAKRFDLGGDGPGGVSPYGGGLPCYFSAVCSCYVSARSPCYVSARSSCYLSTACSCYFEHFLPDHIMNPTSPWATDGLKVMSTISD